MPIPEVDENQPDALYEKNRRSFEFEENKIQVKPKVAVPTLKLGGLKLNDQGTKEILT